MALTQRALETLVDLVEIKLSCLEVFDREDARELANLQKCREELFAMCKDDGLAEVVSIDQALDSQIKRGRGG